MVKRRKTIMPASMAAEWATKFAYVYGVQVGTTLRLSGQIARDGAGNLVGKGDAEAQAVQIFENIKTVVETAGGTLANVVSTTTYITDRSFRLPVNTVRHRYFEGPDYPTNTLLIISGLGLPEYLVEIEAIAELPE